MNAYWVVVLAAVILTGCLTNSGENWAVPKKVSALSFDSVGVSGRTIFIVVRCGVPEPCWQFAKIDYVRLDNTFTITVLARRSTDNPCPEVMSSIPAPYVVTVESAASYSFKFWKNGGTTLDTILVVR